MSESNDKPITAILADDERLMREQLKRRLVEVWPELELLGEAKNGREALELIEQTQPDLAFLDIRMPEMTGIEVARDLGGRCHVVFITAYDQYAIEAFEQGAIDYVLKPAERERLALTVGRLKARLRPGAGAAVDPQELSQVLTRLAERIESGAAGTGAGKREYLQWIQASMGQSLRLIPVQEILFFQSDEKYTRVQTVQVEALIKKPIKELIEELDPAQFWQIHRSTLVNTNAIAGVARDFRGRQIVTLKGHPEKLEVSRSFTHLFKQM
ncbi:MAG: LytTR family DNA-binding domain-containing protein [Burkholderiaceae bacterium]|jgi:DNA-binding LytR/AlgR family response regulator